jgi:hypothetical protein
MSNARYTQFYYTKHKQAVQLDCNFVVDSANGNGLGIRSLKGGGIQNVYMKTSATAAAGNKVVKAGLIQVVFQDNFARYFGGYSGAVSALSGTSISSGLTIGSPYVIVSVGSSTLAQWQAAGVPVGITPDVGVSFIATATSVAGGGLVQAPVFSGLDTIEVVGDPNETLTSSALNIAGVSSGSYMLLQCYLNGTAAAPVDGSVIGMTFVLSNSSILVQGE